MDGLLQSKPVKVKVTKEMQSFGTPRLSLAVLTIGIPVRSLVAEVVFGLPGKTKSSQGSCVLCPQGTSWLSIAQMEKIRTRRLK
jgi:hypothetical protein